LSPGANIPIVRSGCLTTVYNEISAAGAATGWQRLKPIKELLSVEITYGEIRLVAAHRRAQTAQYRSADWQPAGNPNFALKDFVKFALGLQRSSRAEPFDAFC